MPELPLRNQVAVVAGATRGAGRGIARMLGAAGATVLLHRAQRTRPARHARADGDDRRDGRTSSPLRGAGASRFGPTTRSRPRWSGSSPGSATKPAGSTSW